MLNRCTVPQVDCNARGAVGRGPNNYDTTDNPYTGNISSEGPDTEIGTGLPKPIPWMKPFLNAGTGGQGPPPPGNPGPSGPNGWYQPNYVGFAECIDGSLVQQTAQGWTITPNDPNCSPYYPPPQIDWQQPNGDERPKYYNARQTATVACFDGTPFTQVIEPNVYWAWSQAIANQKALSMAYKLAYEKRMCFDSSLPTVCDLGIYSGYIVVIGAPRTITWQIVSGSLPPGLTLLPTSDTMQANFIGAAVTPGNYTFTVRASDASGTAIQKAFIIRVMAIDDNLPPAEVGVAYAHQMVAMGGLPPHVWSVASGSLPTGLSMDSGGFISGTPTTEGTFNCTINARDSS